MKTRQLLLSIVFLFTTIITFAQAQFTNTGIAVQGIARDANNTAIQNQTIVLKFTFLYETGTTDVEFKVLDKSIVTDNFGVFSSIIDPGFINNEIFSNQKVFIRINNGAVQLSREPLNVVPYAISANNGSPTGSIMPYMGTTAPAGWLMCDGRAVPVGPLRDMIGTVTPNLRGVFLRGAGGTGRYIGPSLAALQNDAIKSHSSSGTTSTNGIHTHNYEKSYFSQSDGNSHATSYGTGPTQTSAAGSHNHTVTTDYDGATETRPFNYGVNYIIKL